MKKLVGIHAAGSWENKLEIIRRWQPPLVLVLQPEVDKVRRLKEACPKTIIIGRFYHDDSHYSHNISTRPVGFAKDIHREILENPVTPLLDYVQSNNETNQDWEGIVKLNIYSSEWMALADQSGKYKCAIMAFSVGNPDLPFKPGDPAGFDGRMLYWQRVLSSLNYAQEKGHILLLHAYGWPDMFHPTADWYIYRYERQVQENLKRMGIVSLKYAYGEIGIDRLIVGEKGGYKVSTTDQGYVNQLLQWEKDLQDQKNLLGGAIFTFGDSGGWGSYDITDTGVANTIADHYANNSEKYKTFIPSVGKETTTVPSSTPQATVKATVLNVRDKPGTQGSNVVNKKFQGDKIFIFEERNVDGSVWYRIGANEWVIAEWTEKANQPPKTTWERSKEFTLGWEGGFQNLHWDIGNWTGCAVGVGENKGTKFGISACSYPSLDIFNITKEQSEKIYFEDYWKRSGADKLDWPACLLVFDTAVNFHPVTAVKWWQESKGSPLAFCALRLRGYRKSKSWPQAGNAWVDRVIDLMLEGSE